MYRKLLSLTLFVSVTLLTPVPLLAQSDTTPEGVSEEAAQALGKDRGKTEEEQLEEILSSQRNEYDLITAGNMKVDYSASYSYNSNPRSRIVNQTDTGFVINNLTRDSQHTLNQNLSLRYGLFNNLTTGISIPIIAKVNTATDNSVSAFGDVSLSTRYQPYVVRPGQLRMTLFSNLTLPTGTSSFEVDRNQELASGSGLYSFSGGLNFSKAVDPVVAFGNLAVNYSLPRTDVNQTRGSRVLLEVRPGPAVSWGLGMAYSLSYDVSLTYSFNYSISFPSELTFRNSSGTISTVETNPSTTATFNLNTGWRLDPTYQMSLGLGIGLTNNSPDFSISLSFPLVLETPALL